MHEQGDAGHRIGHRRTATGTRRGLSAAVALGSVIALTACATYRPLPLAQHATLVSSLSDLDRQVPAATLGAAPQPIDVQRPLDLAQIGLLAILNDPDLRAETGEMGVAEAGLLQASLLPNPSATLGVAALLGGPGSTPAYSASLSEDIAALVTYRARVRAVREHVRAVNATLLWQEWQVAQKARLLALDLYYDDRSVALTRRELRLVSSEVRQARSATAAGELALPALAPLLAAQATAEQALVTLNLARTKHWQSLDALLGLQPEVRFAIAAPDLPPLPALDPLIARLPQQRPDLVALQLGYASAEAGVRAAILGQFPAFVLGGTWGSDTSAVRSAGPTVTFDLPFFDRNQGRIQQSRATRRLLHEQYVARLDGAVGAARGIAAQEAALSSALPPARQAADSAERLARAARAAYAQGNLDQRSLTEYETTALERELGVVDLDKSIGEDRIALGVELGIGLPLTRIVPTTRISLR
jgi:outer membrane protein TolC